MHAPRFALLAALALLAGCVSEEPAPETDAPAADARAAPQAAVDDGEAPMAADVGHMPHMHDYWQDMERIVLFDGEIDPSQGADPFSPFLSLLVDKEAKLGGGVPWRFPDGAIVFEGTGQMDFTAEWSDPLVTSLQVQYVTGASPEPSAPLALPPGETVSLAVTPEMTDMPHMKTSRWTLFFEAAESPGVAMAPFRLKVEIVKLRDIMTFPGHPELFEGKPEKVIEDGDHEHSEVSYAKRAPNLALSGAFGEKEIPPSQLVPMETKAMRMEITVVEATAAPGEVSEIRFFYHGANTTFMGHPTILPLEGSFEEGRLVYQVPVAMEETDTPYGAQSQWRFFVEPATRFTGQDAEPTAGGMTDVSIRYHLKITVYDHELEEYSPREDAQA